MTENIQYLKGVGEARAKLFAKLGVTTVDALLRFYPHRYIDWSAPLPIRQAPLGEICCIRATVASEVREHKINWDRSLYKVKASDDFGHFMTLTFFNNPYVADKLLWGEEFLFLGKLTLRNGLLEMTAPSYRKMDAAAPLEPVYPLTKGLTSLIVQRAVRSALDLQNLDVHDFLPDALRQENNLCHLRFAIENIHFPKDAQSFALAKARLVFDELFVLQLGLGRLKEQNRKTTAYVIETDYTGEYLKKLPFTLTKAQRRCVAETVNDMKRSVPMRRLLQGDVGSGKTCVAAASMYSAAKNHIQSALMAPTEILAEQHFKTLSKLLENTGLTLALLTGSVKAAQKKQIKAGLQGGSIHIVVGTHALLSDDVIFQSLGLVVTDEQHRFGVNQRAVLFSKGNNPHTLVMSATPIPRTLALMIYGDLDVSVIDELPPGRQDIETYRIDSAKRSRAFGFIKKHLEEGRQAYIICSLVEEGESERKAAVTYAQSLTEGPFQGYQVGLLHGKMKGAEKERVMKSFLEKETKLLVSTTVVEVGVDVPNACVILIEDADRFGLSQLHQLRGRVGRGKHKSYCILVSDNQGDKAKKRFKTICSSNDGFVIAEEDLKMRGPGDFFGNKQHGLPELKIADFMEDLGVLKQAQVCAKAVLQNDPALTNLENKPLLEEVNRLFEELAEGKLS